MSKTIRRNADAFAGDNEYIDPAYQKAYEDQIKREQCLWEKRRALSKAAETYPSPSGPS